MYRQFWGWPLRSPRNLVITTVVVAILAAGVGCLSADGDAGPAKSRRLLAAGAVTETRDRGPGTHTYRVPDDGSPTRSTAPEPPAVAPDRSWAEIHPDSELDAQRRPGALDRAREFRPASSAQHGPRSGTPLSPQRNAEPGPAVPVGQPPAAAPPAAPSAGGDSKRPPAAGCAAVFLLAVPGSYETGAAADPQQSHGMLARVTDPLDKTYRPRQLQVHYVPYPASVLRPVFYPESLRRGVEAASTALTSYAKSCPRASFILVGFSQGAHIAGDLAAQIGAGHGPVLAERVIGVGLLADPRRPPSGAAPTLPAGVPGQGVLPVRPGGFGELLPNRVVEICAPGDPICDNSTGSDPAVIEQAMRSGAHRSYPLLIVDPATGATATTWLTQAGRVAIDRALAQRWPHPASHPAHN